MPGSTDDPSWDIICWKQLPLGLMNEYRVQFDVFEGPLDLLLHLVKKQEVDIYQVNLTRIASEFVAYIDQMRELDLEVAGEFLVMAATLIYIKSRELLPADQKPDSQADEADDEDPRFELIRRLVEYKKFKDAAAELQTLETRMDQVYEHRSTPVVLPHIDAPRREPVSIFDLIQAVSTILKRFNERDDIREIQADPY
ncbi:MAG: segregation and condensation protein A, partial [Verrucomicrobiota bacterium]